jgi:hypothetical protein
MRAGTAPGTTAGRAIPNACSSSAATSSVGCDPRAHSHAHNAAEGTAAKPTTSQAPLPSQPDEFCLMAATRNVPAMM